MGNPAGTTDRDIGRPEPWGEGRYQKPGQSVNDSVRIPPGTVPNRDKRPSYPVTREDYEFPGTPESPEGENSEPPGGDAG